MKTETGHRRLCLALLAQTVRDFKASITIKKPPKKMKGGKRKIWIWILDQAEKRYALADDVASFLGYHDERSPWFVTVCDIADLSVDDFMQALWKCQEDT